MAVRRPLPVVAGGDPDAGHTAAHGTRDGGGALGATLVALVALCAHGAGLRLARAAGEARMSADLGAILLALPILVIAARRLNARAAGYNWLQRLLLAGGIGFVAVGACGWLLCLLAIHAANQGQYGFGGSEIMIAAVFMAAMFAIATIFLGLLWLSEILGRAFRRRQSPEA